MRERKSGLEQGADGTVPETPVVEQVTAASPSTSGRFPFLTISPKWQLILIGGIFIAINIMVMIAFVVALALRR